MKMSAEKASNKETGFSAEEKAAMKERAAELKAAARASKSREEGESAVLAKYEEMLEPDRSMGKCLHTLILASAPELMPKTWYGMPAYYKDEKSICFFQSAKKFKTRYCTLGFNDPAKLDDGAMWPVAFALTKLTPVEEARISALIKKAAG
jgi:uncharacterized protein YdhG (YjbR/CyaY superfamily)